MSSSTIFKRLVGSCRLHIGLARVVVFSAAAWSTAALSQTNDLPSVDVTHGYLVTLGQADSYYGPSTIHTNGLGTIGRPTIITELARGLGSTRVGSGLTTQQYADRVYEYVQHNVRVLFMFGLKKGAVGAVLDQAGTPFDQAYLMGELLKEANIPVEYHYGAISLDASSFYAWTGISNAAAACHLLADGGIPGSVAVANETFDANCGGVSNPNAAPTAVTMKHLWLNAAGLDYDPAFKKHAIKSLLPNLDQAMKCTTSGTSNTGVSCSTAAAAALASGATSGTEYGANYYKSLNYTTNSNGLAQYLSGRSTDLQNYLLTNMPDATLSDVIGGRDIDQSALTPVTSTNPRAQGNPATWPDVPDQFRTKLTIKFDNINRQLFTDEIAGQRIRLMGTFSDQTDTAATRHIFLYAEYKLLANSIFLGGTIDNQYMTLIADHPYASTAVNSATAGTYMDRTVVLTPALQSQYVAGSFKQWVMGVATIINDWGYTGKRTESYFGELQRRDVQYSADPSTGTDEEHNYSPIYYTTGNAFGHGPRCQFVSGGSNGIMADCLQLPQATLAASWQSQKSNVQDVIGAVDGVEIQQHHVLGFVSSLCAGCWNAVAPSYPAIFEEGTYSIVSPTNSDPIRRAAGSSLALLTSRLEGSLAEQSNGIWEGQSSVSLLSRANDKGFKYYQATNANFVTLYSHLSGYTDIQGDLTQYFQNGYEAVLPSTFPLGNFSMPGGFENFGFGGYFAYTPAMLSYAPIMSSKGKGGAGGPVSNPSASALGSVSQADYSLNLRKYRSVNLSDGSLKITPPPLLTTGDGEFPRSLFVSQSYDSSKAVAMTNAGQAIPYWLYRDKQYGWATNISDYTEFDVTGDAYLAMGSKSPVAASSLIAALQIQKYAVQQSTNLISLLTNVFTTQWWAESLRDNAVTMFRGDKTQVFAKLADGSFLAAPGSADLLQQTGAASGPKWDTSGNTAVYDYSSVTFKFTEKDGSISNFSNYPNPPGATGYNRTFVQKDRTFADGMVLTYGFDAAKGLMTSVTNSLGRTLTFIEGDNDSTANGWQDASGRKAMWSGPGSAVLSYVTSLPAQPIWYRVTLPDGSQRSYQYYNSPIANPTTPCDSIAMQYAFPGTSANTPAVATDPKLFIVGFDSYCRTKALTDGASHQTIYYIGANGEEQSHKGESVDELGAVAAETYDLNGLMTSNIDGLGRATNFTYDSQWREKTVVYPEGNFDSFTYDLRSNPLSVTNNAKAGSGFTTKSRQTTYVEGPSVRVCANPKTCNKPSSTTDENANFTAYAWNSSTGQLRTVAGPTPVGTRTDYCYTTYTTGLTTGSISLLTAIVGKEALLKNRVETFTYDSTNKYVLSTSVIDPSSTFNASCTAITKSGALGITTAYTYDAAGNVASVDLPRLGTDDLWSYSFDANRRLTKIFAPLDSKTRYTYDFDGQLTSVRKALVSTPLDTDPTNPRPVLLPGQWQTEARTYWSTGDLKSVTDAEGNVTQYTYDPVGRVDVVTDPDGRKTKQVYDLAGQLTDQWNGWGSTQPGMPIHYVHKTYTGNGKILTITDANNNVSEFAYDGFDRSVFVLYPSPIDGTRCSLTNSNRLGLGTPTCDIAKRQTYEATWYTVDGTPAGARCSGGDAICRKINRRGDIFSFTFDAANRRSTKAVTNLPTVTYSYNYLGDWLSVSNPSAGSYSAHTIAYDYDSAGRKTSETSDGRQVSYQYDYADNRIRTTWPDNYYIQYSYDSLSRVRYVFENSLLLNVQAKYDYYSVIGQRQTVSLGGSANNAMGYTYEADDDLDVLTHTLGSGSTVTFDYDHNRSHQVTSIAASDDFYLGSMVSSGSTSAYSTNALNQYGSVDGNALSYDLNGNLLSWQSPAPLNRQTYTYDAENHLRSVALNGSSTAAISYDYDPLGRRISKTVNGVTTNYLLDGNDEIAELDASGTVLRRYIMGPRTDEHIAVAEGSATSNPAKTYYHTNHLGSVIATTSASGLVQQKFSYDEYGNLSSDSTQTGQAYRYVGRRFDEETGLYYYRARYYSSKLGRFLSTDPVAYADDYNAYTYVKNDPLNLTDPSGAFLPIAAPVIEEIIVLGAGACAANPSCTKYTGDAASAWAKAFTSGPVITPSSFAVMAAMAGGRWRWNGRDSDDDDESYAMAGGAPDPNDDDDGSKKNKNDEDQPASEKTATDIGRRIEQDINKAARREFHDIKESGGRDRTLRQLKQDARDVYNRYGKTVPSWLKP